jgi:hypothetical protein
MGLARDSRKHRKRLQRTLSCSLRDGKAPHWDWRVVPGPSLSADLSLCDPPREGIDLKTWCRILPGTCSFDAGVRFRAFEPPFDDFTRLADRGGYLPQTLTLSMKSLGLFHLRTKAPFLFSEPTQH